MIKFLRELLSDGASASLSRFILFVTVPSTVLVPLLMWTRASWSLPDGRLAEVPGSIIGFMGAANTIVAGIYAWAKTNERHVEVAQIEATAGTGPPGG